MQLHLIWVVPCELSIVTLGDDGWPTFIECCHGASVIEAFHVHLDEESRIGV